MTDTGLAQYTGTVIKRALLLCAAAGLVLWATGLLPWARGLALGTVASCLSLFLMSQMLPKTLNPNRTKAQVLSLGSVAVRFGVMALALAAALKFPDRFAFAAVVIGLFVVQITIFGERTLSGLLGRTPDQTQG